jgi:cytidyltransferase-like protein|tara:strand:+ start:2684 stop:3091 length:408 start_codon:yes stop_codon:yes gene_type:complete
MKRIYVDIVGDLFHLGHVSLFKKARGLGDYLIVGVHSDEDVAFYKRRPVLSLEERSKVIKSCRYVDEVIENAPLVITEEFINEHNISYVVHGDDVSDEVKRQHKIPYSLGIVKYVPYTPGISTTEIIERIKNGNY